MTAGSHFSKEDYDDDVSPGANPTSKSAGSGACSSARQADRFLFEVIYHSLMGMRLLLRATGRPLLVWGHISFAHENLLYFAESKSECDQSRSQSRPRPYCRLQLLQESLESMNRVVKPEVSQKEKAGAQLAGCKRQTRAR